MGIRPAAFPPARACASSNARRASHPASRCLSIDDPSVTGWVSAADLIPRDSKAPAIWGLDTAGGVFSPNGDGRLDVGTLTGRFSESVDWRVQILDGETVVVQKTGTGRDFDVPWDGTHGGVLLPDGAYSFTVRAIDAWGNGPTTKSGKLTIDTVPVVDVDGPLSEVV